MHSALLLSSVLSLISSRCARILEEFHLIRVAALHLTDSLPRLLVNQVALPLRDRKVVSFHDKIYHPQYVYCFIDYAEQLDLLSNL